MIRFAGQVQHAGNASPFASGDGLGIYDENPNPVLRVSDNGAVLYANESSRALLEKWQVVNGWIPEQFQAPIQAALQQGLIQAETEECAGRRIQLQIVPGADGDYVNIFGYPVNIPVDTTRNLKKSRQHSIKIETVKRQTAFARAAVHELRNPLTPIMTASEMLCNRLEEGTTARLARQINTGAIELNARIGELFDLVRAQMGALVLDYQTVELDELLDDVSNALKASVARRQVEFVLEAVGIDGMIEVDRARLREALVLVSESVISRSPAKTQVMLMATIKDRAAVIRIDSTTRRAAQETSRFFAVLGSGKLLDSEDFSSIGLKLTLSRLLIELHGGSITATSDLSGDIFTIIVPICCQKSGDFIS